MCGIAGVYNFSNGRADDAGLEAMRLALHHRGPDDSESVVLGHAGLVHTRLSILDLSAAAHQPMWDTERRACLAYNGEIYNFGEIRLGLERKGLGFRSTGDTEVLLLACLTYGVERTLPLLDGMFAFAFWDNRDGEMWLARDRTGIKPLYYTIRGDQLLFASEIRALLLNTATPRPDLPTLLNLLYGGTPTAPYTPFADIYGLQPGHYMRVARGKPQVVQRPYHSLTGDIDPQAYREYGRMSNAAVTRHFAALLEKSVEIHSISDAPVAVLVSGGVDSAVIAAQAKRLCPEITCYHADVVGNQSELEAAKTVAAHLGLSLKVAAMRPLDYVQQLARTVYYHETPSAYHPNDVPFQLVARLAQADGIKVFLTGEGADELFYGYGEMAWWFLKDRIGTTVSGLPLINRIVRRFRGGLASGESTAFIEDLATRGLGRELNDAAENAYSFIADGAERRAKVSSLLSMYTHLHSLLMRNDRMGMMHSLESRIPFLENDLIRFALNLPMKHVFPYRLHQLLRGDVLSRNKAVVRAAARDLLPAKTVHRKKQGFPVTPLEYLKPCPAFYRDGFLASTLRCSQAELTRILRSLTPERQWNFFATEVFGRLFFLREKIQQVEERIKTCALVSCYALAILAPETALDLGPWWAARKPADVFLAPAG